MGCPKLYEDWRFVSAETAGRKRPYLFHLEKNRSRSAPAEMDDRSEVTSAVSANDSAYNFSFNFDSIGNRTDYTTHESGTQSVSNYTTNELNQYTSITNPNQSPTYDDDGNMLTNGDWTYTWNAENRMVTATNGTTTLEFKYDYQGRRVEKKVYSGSAGNWTLDEHKRFVYDNYEQIEELDALNSNAIAKKRIWSNGKIIADIHGVNTYYALGDANKNITEYVDGSGTVQAHYEYSPFGKITASNGAMDDDFEYRFSSEYLDSETNLVYYNYRYYSPELGRWTKRDMIEEQGGLNLYVFVSNATINNYDINGLKQCKEKLTGYCSTDRVTWDIGIGKTWEKVAKAFGADIEFKLSGRFERKDCEKCCSDCSKSMETTVSYQVRGSLTLKKEIPIHAAVDPFVDFFIVVSGYASGSVTLTIDGCSGKKTGKGCITFGGTAGVRFQTDKWISYIGLKAYAQGEAHVTCKKCMTNEGFQPWKCKGEGRIRYGAVYLGVTYEHIQAWKWF